MFSSPAVKYSNIFPHFGEIRTEVYISHSLFILARQRQAKVTKIPQRSTQSVLRKPTSTSDTILTWDNSDLPYCMA